MAGDNDLAMALDKDLSEIKRARIDRSLNVVVFADRGIFSECPGTFMYVKRDTFLVTLLSLGNLDSGDPGNLSFFITYLRHNFPSDYYALVIWGHGTGWNKSENFFQKSVAIDASTSNSIEVFNGELTSSLPDSLFSVIFFDACLMGSIEVLWELREKTRYVVASPALVPSLGFNYTKLLEMFSMEEKIENILKKSVDDFVSDYDSLGFTVSLGVFDLTKIDTTEKIIKDAVESSYLKTTTELLKYRMNAITYNTYSNQVEDPEACLIDVVSLLKLGWAIDTLPVVLYARGNFRFENLSFLSAYFPLNYSIIKRDFLNYRSLNFQRRTNFLDLVLNTLSDSLGEVDTVRALIVREKNGIILSLQNLVKASRWQCLLRVEKEGIVKQELYSLSEKFLLRLTPGFYKLSLEVIPRNKLRGTLLYLTPDTITVLEGETPYYNSIMAELDSGVDILGRQSSKGKGVLFNQSKKYVVY